MQELLDKIIELIQNKQIGTREKSEWIERLPNLDEEQLKDLLAVLEAQTNKEMDILEQKNIIKLEAQTRELEDLTEKGIKLIYQRGEEVSRQDEVSEREAAIAELQAL